ncbi:hypothetical protein KJ841_00090 [Patescibacteria group bacterium]|nr:hypothetical protein [Patescibacteria group bacterium]
MIKTIDKNDWPLFRMIIPAFPEINIFTRQARKTTALGPIMVATAANKLWRWRVEIIDENNNRKGPRDSNGLPDHAVLQKERPATAVGFYCGLTSTMLRVWELAEFYHQQKVFTIAGAWHAHYCPEETLNHNIDVVVHRDAERVIQQILSNLGKEKFLENIPGISFLENGEFKTDTSEIVQVLGLDPNLSNLPFPDFGLLRYAKIKLYPISRIRGCSGNCEFCSVNEKPHWACAKHLFETVKWLVETRNAKEFFLVDDSLKEDLDGTVESFKMITNEYGNRLDISIQLWLKIAENTEFLQTARRAGVRTACIGVESPIDEDLKAMRKGYTSSKMLEWLKILQRYVKTHIMLIAGYPLEERNVFLSAKEIVKRFRRFIHKAHPDSVHVMLPGPGVGTPLRRRLEKEGRLFPQSIVPWSKYDGRFVCFRPSNMTVRELQEMPFKIMGRFYNRWSSIRIAIRTIIFPLDYIVRGWKNWHRDWVRDVVKFGGYLLMEKWKAKQQTDEFIEKLENH